MSSLRPSLRRLVLLLACSTALFAAGCGPAPRQTELADEPPSVAPVQTADAVVRRLRDNSSPAARAETATPAPVPSCGEAIWWYQAPRHLGEMATVQGPVIDVQLAPGADPFFATMHVGQGFSDPNRLLILVAAPSSPDTLDRLKSLKGESVCVTGTLEDYQGLTAIRLPDLRTLATPS